MTILKRIWRATEVERWGFKDWWDNSDMRFALWGWGIVALIIFTVACWVFVAYSTFESLVGFFL